MELVRLDDNFQPVKLIERYQSLVWAERYASAGDFVLVTPNIEQTLALLPLESTISIRESTVPMVVEVHKISKPTRGVPLLEVRGRACETWLERRASIISLPAGPYTELIPWEMAAGTSSDAAYKAIRAVTGDVERFQDGDSVLSALTPAISELDAIPQVDLPLPADFIDGADAWAESTTYTFGDVVSFAGSLWRYHGPTAEAHPPDDSREFWTNLGPWIEYEIPRGILYNVVLDLIAQNHHGIKSVRPSNADDHKVDIEIYNGADLTEIVQFDARFDQFDDANYLFSKQGSANIAYIFGPNGAQSVRKNNPSVLESGIDEVSGLDRRVIPIDESSDSTLNTEANRISRALIELYKLNATALFDGQTAEQVAAGYNSSYFLGDILKLVGEYGLSANVRVAEFIRSEDSSGEKAYPTFEIVDE